MRPEGRRLRFWRWLHRLAERRVRELYLDRHRHDRRCPACGRWGALHGWDSAREMDPIHTALTCGACGAESVWCEDAMPRPVDPATLRPLPAHRLAAFD